MPRRALVEEGDHSEQEESQRETDRDMAVAHVARRGVHLEQPHQFPGEKCDYEQTGDDADAVPQVQPNRPADKRGRKRDLLPIEEREDEEEHRTAEDHLGLSGELLQDIHVPPTSRFPA